MTSSQLFISVYIDEDVNKQLAETLRERGYSAIAALELGHISMSDAEHLAYASSNQMMLMTSNRNDFIELAHNWAMTGKSHHGIVIAQQYSRDEFGILLDRTLNLLDQVTADEMLD